MNSNNSDVTINDENDFYQKVKKYVNENKPHICILTPCYGGQCYVNYTVCLLNTFILFKEFDIKLSIEFCKGDSLVSRARNNLIAKAMTDNTITHIIFIDSDITWTPHDILKLLLSDKSIVGGSYPLKNYKWENLTNPQFISNCLERKQKSKLNNLIDDKKYIQYNMLRYNMNFISSEISVENNLTRVKHIANGFMLIKRNTIEKMMEAYPDTKYTDDIGFLTQEENKYAYALFDCGVVDDHYLSEDWLFCDRWTRLGGNVYVDVTINLTHSGTEEFQGSFISTIM